MKHTQNNQSNGREQPVVHKMPRNCAPDTSRISATGGQKKPNPQANRNVMHRRPQTALPHRRRKKTTLLGAILAELEERFEGLTIGLPFTSNQFFRAVICGALIVLFAILQSTVFSTFKPFGAVPDLMFSLTVAIAFSEGEKWGGICGLICAVVIDALGGHGITLLPIIYVTAGILCGFLVRDFFSNTALPRVAVITLFTVGRSVVSLISAALLVNITFVEILAKIVIPEYFSTVLMSAPVYLVVWLCLARFHKTRAEKTGI